MKTITKKDILENLKVNRQLFNGKYLFDIFKNLENEKELTEKKAIEIFGGKSWTENICDECGKDAFTVIEIGQEPEYESFCAHICLECLKRAVELIENKK